VVGERRGSERIRRVGTADFDNDGWRDLFTANSYVNDLVGRAIGAAALKVIPLENPSVLKSADFGGDQKCLPTSRKCAAGQMWAKKFSTVLVKPDRVGFCSGIKK
jgi:hypothetical protein